MPWLIIPGVLLTIWLTWRDRVRRTVVVFYEVNGPVHARYTALLDAFGPVCRSRSAWHLVARGDIHTTHQRKINAGAGALVRRQLLRRGTEGAPHLKSNISVPSLRSAARSVYFLPDRILVQDRNTYIDLPYLALSVTLDDERFIETGSVPSDARQVDTTWRFVNKSGRPDRRFNNNRQLPVMLYGRLYLHTTEGLNIIWSFSDTTAARALMAGIGHMQRTSPGAAAIKEPA
jgi:hypothetical protein